MNFGFTQEQEMLRDMVRGICAEYSSVDVVRELEDDPTGYSADFWKQLAELDLLGLTLPEHYGGSGQSMLENTMIMSYKIHAITYYQNARVASV